jgi:PAS domain S-box-containing protein
MERSTRPALRYTIAVAGVVAVLLVGLALKPYLYTAVAGFFLFAIILSVRFGGTGPGLLALALSLLAAGYFFTGTSHGFNIDANDTVWSFVLTIVSLTVVWLAHSVRQASRTLHEREASLQAMLSSIGEAVICADAEGRVTFMNNVAQVWTGWRESEARDQPLDNVLTLLRPDTRHPIAPVEFSTNGRASAPVSCEALLVGRDMPERPVEGSASPLRDEQGRPSGCVLVLRDITDRRLSEVHQREAERLARVAIDALAAHVCVVDASGTIIAVNRSWRRIARRRGFSLPDAGIGANYLAICDAAAFDGLAEAGRFASGLRAVLDGTREEYGQEYSMVLPDGTYWFIVRARRFAGQDPAGAVIAHEDITPLKRAEAELRTLNETLEQRVAERTAEMLRSHQALEQAERLATVGEMLTALGHESRNALQRSQAALELLARRLRENPQALELVAGARKAQADLERIHEELRAYTAPVVLEREFSDLSRIWRDAWNNLAQRRANREAVLHEACGDISTTLEVDPFRMHQVFRNLLENALDACPDPVEVRIEVTAAPVHGRPGICIVVRDNGPGLDPEQAARVFEPFYTTKTKGTGLGMAIVKRIIEAHGGTIDLAGNPGHGAEVTILLPRKPSP